MQIKKECLTQQKQNQSHQQQNININSYNNNTLQSLSIVLI